MDEKTPSDRFHTKHANYVYGLMMLDDRETEVVDQTDGKVYQCCELKCVEFAPHSHRRRPYMIYYRTK